MMTGLESLIRVTAICLMAGMGWPAVQGQIRTQGQQLASQFTVFQDASYSPAPAPHALPTVRMSQELASQILAASSP